MSKISVDLNAVFTDTGLILPGTGNINSTLNKHIEVDDSVGSFDLVGRAYEVAATESFDIASLTGYKGETISMGTIRLMVVHIVKTAETVTGSFAIASTPMGITSGTVTLTGDTQVDAAPVGEIIRSYIGYSKTGVTNGSGNDLTVTLTSPVGFKAQVLLVGDYD